MPRTSAHRQPRSRRRPTGLLLVIAAAILLLVGVASAAAASNIEGVWSFGGGQIAVQPEGNGKFEGVVVSPTSFAECVHPDGQKIWKEIAPQTDGSYWGFHQWYFANSKCEENPTLGPTAWRVIEGATGTYYLRICLSEPGTSQPTIPAGSSGIGASYGCLSSASIAPLPSGPGPGNGGTSGGISGSSGSSGTAGYKESLSLPSAKQCVSVRLFKIHLLEPKYDPFKTVLVTIKHHKIATARHGNYVVATINLKGLPTGAFTVKIVATTVLGHHLSGTRTYHTCAKTAKKSNPSKLH